MLQRYSKWFTYKPQPETQLKILSEAQLEKFFKDNILHMYNIYFSTDAKKHI